MSPGEISDLPVRLDRWLGGLLYEDPAPDATERARRVAELRQELLRILAFSPGAVRMLRTEACGARLAHRTALPRPRVDPVALELLADHIERLLPREATAR